MEMNELTKQTTPELTKLLSDKREALRVWRFGLTGSKVKNIRESRTTKKDIARILTALNMKIAGTHSTSSGQAK